MQNKYKIKYILSSLAILVVPQFALLSTTQPKGQMPILEPLQPAPKNIKPNISNNIQLDTGSSQVQVKDGSAKMQEFNGNSEISAQNNQNEKENLVQEKKSKNLAWFWIILIAGLLGVGSWFFWKKNV